MTDFSIENGLNGQISGVDEAGRGPLAGPVVAAAVIFKTQTLNFLELIDDSKKLSEKKRLKAYDYLINCNEMKYGIGICSPQEIDRLNILKATFTAMERALKKLKEQKEEISIALIDGNHAPKIFCKTQAIIKGDGKSTSIAAASIIAKTTRDEIMKELAKNHPEYGWEQNFGYPTKEHVLAIKKYGITEHHRKTFAPIAQIISQGDLF